VDRHARGARAAVVVAGGIAGIAASFAAVVALDVGVFVAAARKGVKALEAVAR